MGFGFLLCVNLDCVFVYRRDFYFVWLGCGVGVNGWCLYVCIVVDYVVGFFDYGGLWVFDGYGVYVGGFVGDDCWCCG